MEADDAARAAAVTPTLTDDEVRQAADLLVAPREGRGSLVGLPPDLTPTGTADVQRVIDAVSVGDAIPSWRDVVFDEVPLQLTVGERVLASVVGCHPFDDPFLPVVVGVNRLRRGPGTRAGEVILTSSSTSFFPVEAGAPVRAVYGGLGEVVATFDATSDHTSPALGVTV